jgi:hypothetical protein
MAVIPIDQMAITYTNILQDPPKFTQIGILGLKMCHLATLLEIQFFGTHLTEKVQPVNEFLEYFSG